MVTLWDTISKGAFAVTTVTRHWIIWNTKFLQISFVYINLPYAYVIVSHGNEIYKYMWYLQLLATKIYVGGI